MVLHEPSIKYLVRLMEVLTTHQDATITNLAMLSRMNQTRCVNLVKQLEQTGYITTRINGRKTYFFLTDNGKDYATKLLDINRLNTSLYG